MIQELRFKKIKKDTYFKKRGGVTKICDIVCTGCNRTVLVYQKDGPGWLKRCYENRVILPKTINIKKNLLCDCGNVLASPVVYKDGRFAWHLITGKFKRRKSKYDKKFRS